MIKNILRQCFVVLLCQALAYAPLLRADQSSLPSNDLVAAKITQEQYIDKVSQGSNHQVTVTVTDNVDVKEVILFYRSIGTEDYNHLAMDNIVNTDDYYATVNADQIKAPGLEYYVQAMDSAGNTSLYGYSFSPLSVKTVAGDTDIASANSSTAYFDSEKSESSNMWLWIGLGALAVVVAIAAGGGGSDDGGGTPSGTAGTATLTINANNPNQ